MDAFVSADIVEKFAFILIGAIHLVIISAVLCTIIFILGAVMRGNDKFVSCVSIMSALIAYYISKALGISVSEIVLRPMTEDPTRLPLMLLGFVFPAAAGIVANFILITAVAAGGVVGRRLSIMFFTLLLLAFVDTYLAAVHNSSGLDKQLAPNASFVLGFALVLIFVPGIGGNDGET